MGEAKRRRSQQQQKQFRRVERYEDIVGPRDKFIQRNLQADPGSDADEHAAFYDYYKTKEHYINPDYYVVLDKECNPPDDRFIGSSLFGYPVWNLRIMRTDGGPVHDWVALQEIKNAIVGPEYEAIEIYPAARRLMDQGNCYHLWVLMPKEGETKPPQVPLGTRMRQRHMIQKKTFEQMSPKARRRLFGPNPEIAFIPEHLIPVIRVECGDYTQESLLEYMDSHPDVLASLERWQPEEEAAAA